MASSCLTPPSLSTTEWRRPATRREPWRRNRWDVVTDLDGNRIGFGRATGRYFAKILSALILLIGFIMAAFTQKKQGLHDIIAGTLVVKKAA
jgi:hypothetical protein